MPSSPIFERPQSLCILYHYYEANSAYQKNFQHFLTFGTSIAADIYCLIAGECSFDLPAIDNVHYIQTINKNWDYGGYALALTEHIPIDAYAYFGFINSSVRGPFVSPATRQPWSDGFISRFSEGVGAVGCAINILPIQSPDSVAFKKQFPQFSPPYAHLQTTAYMLSAAALKVLMRHAFYGENQFLSKSEIIQRYEILLSQLLLYEGFNIQCLLPEYNQIDYRLIHSDINPTSDVGDPSVPDGYFGRTIHPYEGMFIKTQRHLHAEHYLDQLTQSMLVAHHPPRNYLALPDQQQILLNKYAWESQEQVLALLKKLRKTIKRYWRV